VSFGQHLRTLRTTAGLSRAEAARRARVPTSTLSGWENDRGFPPLAAPLRLAKSLGVSAERLAEGWKIRRSRRRAGGRSRVGR
jgi:transcriptional regulator with XRE-family HTH domain